MWCFCWRYLRNGVKLMLGVIPSVCWVHTLREIPICLYATAAYSGLKIPGMAAHHLEPQQQRAPRTYQYTSADYGISRAHVLANADLTSFAAALPHMLSSCFVLRLLLVPSVCCKCCYCERPPSRQRPTALQLKTPPL